MLAGDGNPIVLLKPPINYTRSMGPWLSWSSGEFFFFCYQARFGAAGRLARVSPGFALAQVQTGSKGEREAKSMDSGRKGVDWDR
jgi:hypothetical protein